MIQKNNYGYWLCELHTSPGEATCSHAAHSIVSPYPLTRRSRGPVLPSAIHVSPLALLLQAINSLQAEPVRELKAPASKDLHTATSDLSQLPPFMPLPVPKEKPLYIHTVWSLPPALKEHTPRGTWSAWA